MLFRNLLVALPGLVTPATQAPRYDVAESTSISPLQSLFGGTAGTLQTGTGDTLNIAPLFQKGTTAPDMTLTAFLAQGENQNGNEDPSTEQPSGPPSGPGETTPDPDPTPNVPPPAAGTLPALTENLAVEAGRVFKIDLPQADDDNAVVDIRILTQGAHGHVSVNPDQTLSLVLSEAPSETAPITFSYEITYASGHTRSVETQVSVTPGQQDNGWGKGEFYMLEEGRDGKVIVEHGEAHRKVYVTAGQHGLTAGDIAKKEGISADKITTAWLAEHPEYGGSPELALSTGLGMKLWGSLTMWKANSNWLLFERGYEYEETGRLVNRASSGESALNPLFVGAYGEGGKPIIRDTIEIYQDNSNHVVIQDLDLRGGMMSLQGTNLLLDQISMSGKGGLTIQNVTHVTLNDGIITDVVRDSPVDGGPKWEAHTNRMTGAYIANSTGVLIEGALLDRNGWAEGYDANLSSKSPQPPSMYSQNLYLQYDNLDVTLRDSIIMRGASFGAQVRSGGLIEGNSFIDNNAAVNFMGGNYQGAGPIGNYTLMLDNLVTSAGHKRVSEQEGALSMGIDGGGSILSSYIGNIVAHLADPSNPTEQAQKQVVHGAFSAGKTPYFNDTIIYNWFANDKSAATNPNTNTAGLKTAVLDQTTIQNFAAQLLGKETATISDLASYLRAQAGGNLDHVVDADLIIAFFRQGFGLETDLRADADTLRFSPDARAEGMRWDNRLNWSTGDLPGTQNGDSVDLGGNRVLFGAQTVTIDDFIFGDFGQLKASSGRLNIAGDMSVTGKSNLMEITNAGQVWVDGYRDSDVLLIDAQGGRFANTGAFTGGVAMTVGGDAQAILATEGGSFNMMQNSSLTINGTKAKVGFDGSNEDTAVLRLYDDAKLSFVADANGFGKVREFHSGAFDADVTSGVRLGGDLVLDFTGWTADQKATSWTLIDADQLIGSFDDISVTGLGNRRDLLVRVDYVKDEVTLLISANGTGTGQVRMNASGEADFIKYTNDAALKQLWTDLHTDLPQVSDNPF